MLRSDIVFHDIVVDINRGDVDLTLPEWALFRRTMTDLYNPRGPLWALCGMTVWRKIFPRSFFSPIVVGLYCWEASWNFHEKYPVASFFRDVSLMNPSENQLAAKLRNEFPRINMNAVCDQRGPMHRFSDFMRLKRTRLMFFGTKTAVQLHRATGVGTITCDFGPKPQKTTDIAFVLGSHTSIGKRGFPVLRGIGNSKVKKGAVQPKIEDFNAKSSTNSRYNQRSHLDDDDDYPCGENGNNNNNENGGNNSGNNNNNESTGSAKWTGTIGGCAEIAVPPTLGDEANPDYPSSTDHGKGGVGSSIKANLASRRLAILRRLRGSASAKHATTDEERQKNLIRDVPLKTVWAYTASDDFIANSDYILGGMWFLIQLSAAWDMGWIIGGEQVISA